MNAEELSAQIEFHNEPNAPVVVLMDDKEYVIRKTAGYDGKIVIYAEDPTP